MNSVQLKNHLLKMMEDAITNDKVTNAHACFWYAVIETIMKYYMTVSNYYEENAIATFQLFLDKGILNFNL